jgi:hypothetical protein
MLFNPPKLKLTTHALNKAIGICWRRGGSVARRYQLCLTAAAPIAP